MSHVFFLSLFLLLGSFASCQKNSWNRESADQRLDDVITTEFKARDADGNGILTSKEIRDYYESHPEKMSKEGLEFLDRNFNGGVSVDMNDYRKIIKKWLAQKGSVEKILVGVFGNNTQRLQSHHVWRPKSTTVAP